MHIKELSGFEFKWSLVYEGVFGVVQPQSGWVFASFRNHGRNTDSSEHTWDLVAVEIVGSTGRIGAEKAKVVLSVNKWWRQFVGMWAI